MPYVQHAPIMNVTQLPEMTKCRLVADDRMLNVTVLGCLRMNVIY